MARAIRRRGRYAGFSRSESRRLPLASKFAFPLSVLSTRRVYQFRGFLANCIQEDCMLSAKSNLDLAGITFWWIE